MLELAQYLLDNGADTEIENTYGNKALHVAAIEGRIDILKLLLNKDPSEINTKGENDNTPLNLAALNGQVDIVSFLLKYNASISELNEESETVLHIAANEENSSILKLLLERCSKEDLLSIDSEGYTALHNAIESGYIENVTLILEKAAKLKILGQLLSVTTNDKKDVLSLINGLENKAHGNDLYHAIFNHNVITEENKNDIFLDAVRKNCLDLIKILVNEFACDVNAKSTDGTPALGLAASQGHLDVVQYLIENGANTKAIDNEGLTALHIAADCGQTHIVSYLLDQEPELIDTITSRNHTQAQTALHIAARTDNYELAELLVARGAATNVRNNAGQNALHVAASAGSNPALLALLLDNTHDLSTVFDNKGNTPLLSATEKGHLHVINQLHAKAPKLINVPNNKGLTPLNIAIINYSEKAAKSKDTANDKDVVAALLGNGANPNLQFKNINLPLYDACKQKSIELIEPLIEAGANIKALFATYASFLLKNEILDAIFAAMVSKNKIFDTLTHEVTPDFIAFCKAVIKYHKNEEKKLDGLEYLTKKIKNDSLLQPVAKHSGESSEWVKAKLLIEAVNIEFKLIEEEAKASENNKEEEASEESQENVLNVLKQEKHY